MTKLSDIVSGSAMVPTTDKVVGVRNGNTDVQLDLSSLFKIGGGYIGDAVTAAQTLTLIPSAPYAFTINSLKSLGTVSGTVTGALKINGTNVTGCSALSLTSTPQNATATAANTVAAGDVVTFVTTAPSSLTGLLPFELLGTKS